MDAAFKERLLKLHQVGWHGARVWLALAAAFIILEGMLLLLLTEEPSVWQVSALAGIVLLLAHVMHGHTLALHEAAHGLLCPVRWLNDFMGLHTSPFSFLSLELYRAAHHSHHAYLGSERDEELWPFVRTTAPRWVRRLAALLELTCGLVYTSALFLRAFLRPGTVIRNRATRRRIWIEMAGIVAVWTVVVTAAAWWNLWLYLLVMYLVPAWLAANMQSLRKYIEHLGMTGSTALGLTRSVYPPSLLGRLVSVSMFHEPFHGIHHRFPQLPHEALPQLPGLVLPDSAGEKAPFASYRAALWDMLPSLSDPRIGPQWQAVAPALPVAS
jgi:fatty acid desaturase